jgi:hypothetical protein
MVKRFDHATYQHPLEACHRTLVLLHQRAELESDGETTSHWPFDQETSAKKS